MTMIKIERPERVGMSSVKLNELDAAMMTFIDQGKYAGINTLVARYGKVVQVGCYGKLDIAANKPMKPDSLFRIYSLTKTVTSVATLMLYEEGHFDLNDPVSNWIPEFKSFKVLSDCSDYQAELVEQTQEMTFWHLLTHTCGLGYGINTEPIEEIYHANNILTPIYTLQHSLSETVQKIAKLPLAAQPGAIWHYGLAHETLGYLIGKISGQPFDQFLAERIFTPLDMVDTGFYVPVEKRNRFGPLYGIADDHGLPVLDHPTSSPFLSKDTAPSGGCGVVSTMSDYFRFMSMLAGSGELEGVRLLKPDTVAKMTTNQLNDATFPIGFNNEPWPDMGYGLGIGVQVADIAKIGWIGACGSMAWIYPKEELIIITMPQAFLNWEANDTVTQIVFDAIAT